MPPSGHGVNDAALSANGARLVTTGLDRQTLVWDVDTWTIVERIHSSSTQPYDKVAFRPDGDLLACGPGPFIYLWRLGDDAPKQWEKLIDEPFRCYGLEVVSKLGLGAYTTQNGDIVLFDVGTGAIRSRHRRPGSRFKAPVLSPSGEKVAVFDRALYVLDTRSWQSLHVQAVGVTGFAGQAAFSPDGAYLALSLETKGIALLDTRDFHVAREVPFPFVGQVVFTPDGTRAVAAPMTRRGGRFDGSTLRRGARSASRT